MIKKVLLGIVGVVLLIFIFIFTYINLSWDKGYAAEFPVSSDIQYPTDSATIARGKYLVYGPAHCAHCHVPQNKIAAVEKGQEVALTGGFGIDIPPGVFWAPNITTDEETGIGRYSDGEIYRMLRHNVRPNGLAAIDFMPFINMSEEDVLSIIAYLRSTKPVRTKVMNTEYTFLGKAIMTAGMIKPGIPDEPVPESVTKEPTIEYGKYLAYAVANCRGCHTNRDLQTGEYTGPYYAGGLVFDDNLGNGWKFTTPNLTDHETGVMKNWTETMFITRMKGGRVYENSPMPWASFASMDTVELTAIYRYLKSLDPVENKIARTAVPPGQ